MTEFTFEVRNKAEALRAAGTAFERRGGRFTGNEDAGFYEGNGFKGTYEVRGATVLIKISEKPFYIPDFLVERTIRRFFGVDEK
jgi:hypothetical protein